MARQKRIWYPCKTSGVYDADALKSARELLGITLYGMETDGEGFLFLHLLIKSMLGRMSVQL